MLLQVAASYPVAWNTPVPAVRLYANAYYVGTQGLSSVLVTSGQGHILLDAGLPESASSIMRGIRELGFRVEDVRLIVTSHAHFDHVGGVAALQRASGAAIAASASAAAVLRNGRSGSDDPQYGIAREFPAVDSVRVIADGDTLRVGTLAMIAHFTPGHTPGGTSWSWRSCDGGRCLDFVYADSQMPISADGFYFTRSSAYPSAIADFEHGFALLEHLPCDVLVTPHPEASGVWERGAARDRGDAKALRDPGACHRYVAQARERLARRIASERATPE